MFRCKAGLSLVLLFALCLPQGLLVEAAPLPKRPKLVVLLVVDQMRADYPRMYGSQWKHGLRRLMERGAWFTQAAYPYMNTVTCPGHATIGTGSFPATHGVILNSWWDRAAGKSVSCTEDPKATTIVYGPKSAEKGMSAWRLEVPTFADQLRMQTGGKARVVTFSLKARSAIMSAGHGGEAVTWLDEETGTWVSSDAFSKAPVPYIEKFARENPIARDNGRVWMRLLPEKDYRFDDDGAGERPPAGWEQKFPHPVRSAGDTADIAFFNRWIRSPFADEYLARFAMAAVEGAKLGQGEATDFLGVSFSTLDLVGHDFGPMSHEVQDVLARLDVTLGSLLDFLDRRLGPDSYVVAFSADHGLAQLPEYTVPYGPQGGRIATQTIAAGIDEVLKGFLQGEKFVARMTYPDVYFAPGVFEKLRGNPAAMRAVEDKILSYPGVWRVFRSDELQAAKSSEDIPARAAALSYYPWRSGDLIVLPRPNWFFVAGQREVERGGGTTHGTSHAYDARVPVILMGAGIRAGEYLGDASPADIAPTLAYLCGVTLPRPDGRVLDEALEPTRGRPAAKFDQ